VRYPLLIIAAVVQFFMALLFWLTPGGLAGHGPHVLFFTGAGLALLGLWAYLVKIRPIH
jgi:hypothetical protein